MGLKPGYKQTDVGVIPEDWDVKGQRPGGGRWPHRRQRPRTNRRRSGAYRRAHPCHEDRHEPVRGRRSPAFSQDRRRTQAPRGLIPIQMPLGNSSCLTEVV
jgi:hypothetical protein